jgi:hypothetical protein
LFLFDALRLHDPFWKTEMLAQYRNLVLGNGKNKHPL